EFAGNALPLCFLRLHQSARVVPEGLLGALAFSNVLDHALHADRLAVFINQSAADFDRHATAVTRDYLNFIGGFTFVPQLLADLFPRHFKIAGVYESRVVRADNIFAAIAAKRFGGPINGGITAV